MPATEKLTYAFDPNFNLLWTFGRGTEFDQPITRSTATTAIPFADYGYNALGTRPGAIGPTILTYSFIYLYDATYPNWSALYKGLAKAFAHGRLILLEKLDADGVLQDVEAVCTEVPRKATLETMIYAKVTLKFEQRSAWKGPFPVGWTVFDTGLLYDNSLIYDNLSGAQFTTTGQYNSFTITNAGTAIETDAIININGPIPGPFSLVNTSLTVRGLPADPNNNANPLSLTINDSLPAATDSYAINCRTGEVFSNRPGVPWTNVTRATGQAAYFLFGPGANGCTLNQAAATPVGATFAFTYRDRYR